jgi:hypothetical protein
MKGDFSRFSYQASKRYAGVLMQQGRVTLDADWNEQFDIEDHRWRTQTIDTIGRACAPIGNDGFELALTPDGADLIIKPGRIYIDGILLELDEESGVTVTDVTKDVEWHLSAMSPDGRPLEAGQWLIVTSPEAEPVVSQIVDVGDTLVVLGSDPGLDAHAASNAATVRRVVTYLTQPYFPSDFGETPPADEFVPEEWKGQTHLAYLTVWRSPLSKTRGSKRSPSGDPIPRPGCRPCGQFGYCAMHQTSLLSMSTASRAIQTLTCGPRSPPGAPVACRRRHKPAWTRTTTARCCPTRATAVSRIGCIGSRSTSQDPWAPPRSNGHATTGRC